MHHIESDRSWAARHVQEGERRIAWQEAHIAECRSRDYPTELFEDVLASMRVSLDNSRDHLTKIEADLDGWAGSPG